MIRRSEHSAANRYAQISRKLAQDSTLSFGARGLMLYILSKPANWEVKYLDLMRAGGIGRDALRTLMRELKAAGYFRCTKSNGGNGQFVYEQEVLEEPEPLSAETQSSPEDDPDAELTSNGEPVTDNPPLVLYKEHAGARTGLSAKTEESTQESVRPVSSVSAHVLRRARPQPNGYKKKPPAPVKTYLEQGARPCDDAVKAAQQACPDVDIDLTIPEWRNRRISQGYESTDWNSDFVAYCITNQKRINEGRARYANAN